jgi:hypothetical protein
MTDQVREKAVHAADTLTDFIGDLVGGTALLRQWATDFKAGRVSEPVMVSVQKICVSHLVLALSKFTEFYSRFNQVIPSEYLGTCKTLAGEIRRKGVVDFRNKCVGLIWDKEQQRPLLHSEIMMRLARLTAGDMSGFSRVPALRGRVCFAVASLLLLFDSSPSRIGKYGCFYAHKRRSP